MSFAFIKEIKFVIYTVAGHRLRESANFQLKSCRYETFVSDIKADRLETLFEGIDFYRFARRQRN